MTHEEKEPLRMKVKFIEEWMGNPIGSEKTIMTLWAKDLLARKVVVLIEEQKDDKKEKKTKESKDENKKEEKKGKESKEDKKDDEDDTTLKLIKRAPKDKMMKNQEVK